MKSLILIYFVFTFWSRFLTLQYTIAHLPSNNLIDWKRLNWSSTWNDARSYLRDDDNNSIYFLHSSHLLSSDSANWWRSGRASASQLVDRGLEPQPSHTKDSKVVLTAFSSGIRHMRIEWEIQTRWATSGPAPRCSFHCICRRVA